MSRLVDLAAIPPLEMRPGSVIARRIEGERITMAVFELQPGAVVPEHEHPAEQMGLCLRGSLTFTVGDERRTLSAGGTWNIPSGVPHRAEAGPVGAVAVEVFSPIRDDWDVPVLVPRTPVWPTED
jgi:quercetin dioxygenase-like cupin family protein